MATSDPSEFVTLVSSDGFEFVIRREAAYVAKTLQKMLDPKKSFAEALSGRVQFENINGLVLEKVCEYLYYNEKHQQSKEVADMEIPPELCLELLMAADYLDV